MAGLQKNGKSGPHLLGAGSFDTICTAVCNAVSATLLVGCVVWSSVSSFFFIIMNLVCIVLDITLIFLWLIK